MGVMGPVSPDSPGASEGTVTAMTVIGQSATAKTRMTNSAVSAEPQPHQAPHTSIDWSAEPDLESLRRARSCF